MAGKRKNYRPIWKRIRFLVKLGRLEYPLKLWWRDSDLHAELVDVDEESLPLLRMPKHVRTQFLAIDWGPIRKLTGNNPKFHSLVETVLENPEGRHSPNTIGTAVFGPLQYPGRSVHSYNFADQFCIEGSTLKRIFPELCSQDEPVAVEYDSSRLYFIRSQIDPLSPMDKLRIRTPQGSYVITKQDFESEFANVVNSASYQESGSYSYRIAPEKARRFLDLSGTKLSDKKRYSIGDILEMLVEMRLVKEMVDGWESLEEGDEDSETRPDDDSAAADTRYLARNVILFGPPGTGKSYRLQSSFLPAIGLTDENEEAVFRVTLHPESSYFDFVGSYKPLLGRESAVTATIGVDGAEILLPSGEPARPIIYYGFEPGPFTDALVAALETPGKMCALVIEEINRGNCAAVFGDLLQLLDRDEHHRSQYAIRPTAPLAAYLHEKLGREFKTISLPSNLFLYATMNTSDQSLFPMDTAFKRRWSLEYVGISFSDPAIQEVQVPVTEKDFRPWWAVATTLNGRIADATGTDDKQMGPYFIQADIGDRVEAASFRSKVLFYLWNDVFRGPHKDVFDPSIHTYDALVRRHREQKAVFSPAVLDAIGFAAASPPVDDEP